MAKSKMGKMKMKKGKMMGGVGKKGKGLRGKQYKLDMNKNGRIDGQDFKMLSKKKKKKV